MSGLSDFGYIKRSTRQQLLSRLVCKILTVQPGDDNYELALEFCLHNVDFHRFTDVSPNKVDQDYDSLQARMAVNAQFGKQRALQQLRALFLRQPLSRDTLEVHHRILAALLSLSRRPLQHDYSPPPFLTRTPTDSSLCPGGSEDAASDVSELSAWEEEAAGSDELSDWSDDGTDLIPAGSPTEQTDTLPPPRAPGPPPKPAWPSLSQAWEAGKAAKVKLQPPQDTGSPAYQDGCLLSLLAASRARGVPFITPSTRLFFTEQDLVFQVLHMLRGSPSPGRALTLNPNSGTYEVTAGAHVAHLSLGCLHNMLRRFTRSGTISYRLQMFVRHVRAAATTPSETSASAVVPTLAGFAAALADELAIVQAALIGAQEDFAAAVRQGGNAAADVGLIALDAAVQAPMRRLRLLEAVMSVLEVGEPGAVSAAAQGAALLDGLHGLLRSLSTDATPQGRAEVAVVLRLLVRSARPLLEALDAWLQHGLLTDSPEFFICSGPVVPLEDAEFWHGNAYFLRTAPSGGIICLAFLRPLAGAILAAGKSALLLRMKQPHGSGAALSDVAVANPGRTLLHADILQRLRHAVSYEEINEEDSSRKARSAPVGSLAERMASIGGHTLATTPSYLEAGAHAAEHAAGAFSAASNRATAMRQPPGVADVIARPLCLPGEHGWGLSDHLTGNHEAMRASGGFAYPASDPSGLPRPGGQGAAASPERKSAASGAECPSESSADTALQSNAEAQRGVENVVGAGSDQAVQSSSGQFAEERDVLGGGGDVSGVLGDVSNLRLSGRRPCQPASAKKTTTAPGAAAEQPQPVAQRRPLACRSAVDPPADLSTIRGTDKPLKDWYSRMLDAMRNPTTLLDAERCTPTRPPHGSRQSGHGPVPASVQATLISSFSGKAVQQMWGAKWKQHEGEDGVAAAWLSGLQDPDLPPVDITVQECLLASIQEQVQRTGEQLLHSLMGAWSLRQQLTALHNVYLLLSPAMQPYTQSLFRLLAERGDPPAEAGGLAVAKKGDQREKARGPRLEAGEPALFELQGVLEQCLADQRHGVLLPPHAVTLEVVPQEEPAAGQKRGGNAVSALRTLRLRLRLPWPLSLVVQESHMEQYNDITTLLLQVGWVRAELQGLRDIASPAARGIDACDGLCWQMTHFVTHLHSFIMDCLVHAALPELSQALEAARSLGDVVAAHGSFLGAAERAAMTAKERTWLLVLAAAMKLLDLALRFADIAQDGKAGAREIDEIRRDWRDRHRYLMRLLTARTLRSGGFASLERLAARLDFNGFYCSAEAAAY